MGGGKWERAGWIGGGGEELIEWWLVELVGRTTMGKIMEAEITNWVRKRGGGQVTRKVRDRQFRPWCGESGGGTRDEGTLEEEREGGGGVVEEGTTQPRLSYCFDLDFSQGVDSG